MWEEPLLSNLQNEFPLLEGKNVLILGAGNCILAELLTTYGAAIYLIDKKHLKNAKENIYIVRGNIEQLPFKNDFFDLVISCSTFQYVDHLASFVEIARVAKCGSLVFLHENKVGNPFVFCYRLLRHAQSLIQKDIKKYQSSIKKYLREYDIPKESFTIERKRNYYFISALCFFYGNKEKSKEILIRIDDFIIDRIKFLEYACWFCTYKIRVKK